MIRLALGNILHRPTRTALTAIAIAAEVSLVLVLVGLSTGTLSEAGKRIENIRSDLIVLPPGAQYVLGMSSAVMPLEPVRSALEATPGVLAAAPVAFTNTNRFGSPALVFGIEPTTYTLVGRGALEFLEGRGLEGPDDLVVDARLARAKDLKVGQKVDLLSHDFVISGIVRDGAGVRMYVPIVTLQDMIGRQAKASVFFVRVADPERISEVLDHLRRMPAFKGYHIIASKQYTELLGEHTFGVAQFHAAITVIALVFGFIAISLSMYTTILERTRQIGILKSLGAGYLFIAFEVLLEATLLCCIGLPLGFAIAALTKSILTTTYPTLIIAFTYRWSGFATLLAFASGILGAVYPAFRASTVDPVVAMSYE